MNRTWTDDEVQKMSKTFLKHLNSNSYPKQKEMQKFLDDNKLNGQRKVANVRSWLQNMKKKLKEK